MADPLPTETPDEVFEALLDEWRYSESRIISEWGRNDAAEEAEADREAAEWRGRFGNAIARERNRAAKRMATQHQPVLELRLLRSAVRQVVRVNDSVEGVLGGVRVACGNEAADALKRALAE